MVRIEGSRRVCIPPASGRQGVVASGTCSLHRSGIILQNRFTLRSSIPQPGPHPSEAVQCLPAEQGPPASAAVSDTFFLREVRLGFAAGGPSTAWGFGSRSSGYRHLRCLPLCGKISVAVILCLIVLLEVCVLVNRGRGVVLVAAHRVIAEHFGFRKLRQITGGIIGRGALSG